MNQENQNISNYNKISIFFDWFTLRLFFIFSFFPYFAPIKLPSDLQPYAFLLSIVILLKVFVTNQRLHYLIWLLSVPAIVGFLFVFMDDFSFFAFRSALTYLSLFTITAATYAVCKSDGNKFLYSKFITIATYVWLLAGTLELLINKTLFTHIISNLSIDSDRGVTGLATEPSFYGIYCLFLMYLNYLINNNNKKILTLLLVQVIFLAQSSITLIFIIIFIVYWWLLYLSMRKIILLITIVLFLYLIIFYVQYSTFDSRIIYVVFNLFKDPSSLINMDVSINARVGHVLLPISGFFDNYGFPRGFDKFFDYVSFKLLHINFSWLGALTPGAKIMSGYGSALFELGIFGLLIIIIFSISILNYFRGDRRKQLLFLLFTNTIMFAAIQLSLPFVGMILAILMSKSKYDQSSNQKLYVTDIV